MSKKNKQLGYSFFSTIPEEKILQIFSYLDSMSICRSTRVCKDWQRLLSDETFLQQRVSEFFFDPFVKQTADHTTYKQIFFNATARFELLVEDLYGILNPYEENENEIGEVDVEIFNTACDEIKKLLEKESISLRELFHQFLKKYRNVNEPYLLGFTLLHVAVECCELDAVSYLINKGADVNIVDDLGIDTPLELALFAYPYNDENEEFSEQRRTAYRNIIVILIENGAEVTQPIIDQQKKDDNQEVIKLLQELQILDDEENISNNYFTNKPSVS